MQTFYETQVQIMLFAIIFKVTFFKKQSKRFRCLVTIYLTTKTELFVLETSLLAYSVLISSVHLTNFAKLSLQGFSF